MKNSIVLGCGRSGTSLLAGAIARAGAFVGEDPYPARDANPKGFFESADVNGVNEWLIASVEPRDGDLAAWQRWLAVLPLDVAFEVPHEIRERMRRLSARAPFCFKDPRFSYTLPAWRETLGDARYLCVFRDPAVTAASMVKECATAGYLASVRFDAARAFAVWTAMYRHVLEIHRARGEWLFVHCDQLVSGEGWDRVERFVDARIARDFAERSLQRSRAEAPVPREAQELYARLCALAGSDSAQSGDGTVARTSGAPRDLHTSSGANAATGASVATGANAANAAPGASVVTPHAASAAPARASKTRAPSRIEVRPASSPELSVILCTYDRRAVLEESLASFERQTAAPGSFEVVVVDDGSKDGTKEWLDRRGLAVPGRIVHRENGGLAAARNTGLALARGKWLLFVNDDTIAFPDLIAEHLAAHTALGDDTTSVLGTFEQPARALDNALMRFLESSTEVFCYAAMQPGHAYDWNRFWTCNVSASRELVLAAGGFDERFRQYGCEDTDLALRLEALGARVHYHAAARAHHRHVLDLAALKKRQLAVARAYVSLFAKHPHAMEHADWRWVKELTLAGCERFVDQRLPDLPHLEEAAATLGALDVGALSDAHPGLARTAKLVMGQLAGLVGELNQIWWRQGFAAGLAERGTASFAELAPAEPWPLATEAPIRVLAWPDWSARDLDRLFSEHGAALADREHACLVLRHDCAIDPPLAVAQRALAHAYERAFPRGERVDVLVLDDELELRDVRRVGASVQAVVRLPSSSDAIRAAWLSSLGVPEVESLDALADVVAAAAVQLAAPTTR